MSATSTSTSSAFRSGRSQATRTISSPPNVGTALCIYSLPHQFSAPFFDEQHVTDFVTTWEDFTLDWSSDQCIKKGSLHSEKLIVGY